MQVGLKGAHDCVKAFSEIDMTEDLGRIEVPTLIIHGDDDQIVPIKASACRSGQLVPNDVMLKEYPGEPHGLAQISAYKDESTPTCSSSSTPEAAIGERDWASTRGGLCDPGRA